VISPAAAARDTGWMTWPRRRRLHPVQITSPPASSANCDSGTRNAWPSANGSATRQRAGGWREQLDRDLRPGMLVQREQRLQGGHAAAGDEDTRAGPGDLWAARCRTRSLRPPMRSVGSGGARPASTARRTGHGSRRSGCSSGGVLRLGGGTNGGTECLHLP